MQPDSTQKTPKHPAVGCKRGYFVDTDSSQVARDRVALFAGSTRGDETRPDRTMSALLIASADSVEELMTSHPEAFYERTEVRHGRCKACGDEWTEHGEIAICPECHSTDVTEVSGV